MQARKTIKEEAKKLMKENIKNVFMVCLFIGIFYTVFEVITSSISEYVIWAGIDRQELSTELKKGVKEAYDLYYSLTKKETLLVFFDIIPIIIASFFVLPRTGFFLKQIEGKKPAVKEFFSEKRYFESFKLKLLIFVKVFLWSLLLVIPGIIKAISYSMAPYLKYKNPEKSCGECIKKSSDLMEGHKGSLFIFYLSFIGWYILASIGLSAMNSVPFIGMYLSIAGNCVFSALINGYILSGEAIFYKELTEPYLLEKYNPEQKNNSIKDNQKPFEEYSTENNNDPFDLKEEKNCQSKNDGEKGGEES